MSHGATLVSQVAGTPADFLQVYRDVRQGRDEAEWVSMKVAYMASMKVAMIRIGNRPTSSSGADESLFGKLGDRGWNTLFVKAGPAGKQPDLTKSNLKYYSAFEEFESPDKLKLFLDGRVLHSPSDATYFAKGFAWQTNKILP